MKWLAVQELFHTNCGSQPVVNVMKPSQPPCNHLPCPVPLSDIVAQHLPRCLQVDLPAVLAVDLPHCERAAMQAVASSSGQLQLLQGELVTQGYFDALAEEVDDLLQVRGTSAAAPVRTLRGCAAAVSLA